MAIKEEERKKLDLFIYSRGGQSDVPWALVSMFREYCQEGSFSVLIPYRAHSAATVISLGADEIVMTKKAELGPIDITMNSGPYNPTENNSKERLPISVEDVTGYFSLIEKVGCERPDEKMRGFELLTKNVHPLALGTVSRLLEETKLVGLRLLSTRAKPFAEEDNREIIKRLSSEVYSHSHSISRTEAKKHLGLEQVVSAEEVRISDDLWSLYKEYRELFQLENPFIPQEHLISKKLDEHTWTDLGLACIESVERFDICTKDIHVKRLKQVPPNVNLNLSGLNLPKIELTDLPQDIDQEKLNEIAKQVVSATVQQALNDAAQTATKEMLASLPQAGFETSAFNAKWKTEE